RAPSRSRRDWPLALDLPNSGAGAASTHTEPRNSLLARPLFGTKQIVGTRIIGGSYQDEWTVFRPKPSISMSSELVTSSRAKMRTGAAEGLQAVDSVWRAKSRARIPY